MNSGLYNLYDFKQNTIKQNVTLRAALEQLGLMSVKILFVLDEKERLVACLTDGDVRRAILAGASADSLVSDAACYHPLFIKKDDEDRAYELMIRNDINALPVLDSNHRISKVYCTEKYKQIKNEKVRLPVVIMAGGKGTRLYPYTKIIPKPLIPIENIPIIERIIQTFCDVGCEDFHIIVNYKKEMIKAYFSENEKDYHLRFWDEEIPLGTGGGLKLAEKELNGTFVMTNCDILILESLKKMVEYHRVKNNAITIVCSLKHFEIPYGLVKFSEGGELTSFEEKPELSFFTNTGYYIMEKRMLNYINENENIGMPDIIDRARNAGERVGIYPISDNAWLDMGQFDSMEAMEKRLREIM